jgi:hypothetical protein
VAFSSCPSLPHLTEVAPTQCRAFALLLWSLAPRAAPFKYGLHLPGLSTSPLPSLAVTHVFFYHPCLDTDVCTSQHGDGGQETLNELWMKEEGMKKKWVPFLSLQSCPDHGGGSAELAGLLKVPWALRRDLRWGT